MSVSVDLASGVATLGVQAETAVRSVHASASLHPADSGWHRAAQFDAMADANRLAEVVKAAGFEATPII